MLMASLLLHLVLILGVKFVAPELKRLNDHLPALEVVLVNAKTERRPDKADTLAQANLDRGGNTEADRKMKSPLPMPKDKQKQVEARLAAEAQRTAPRAAKLQDEVQKAEQQVAEMEKQARTLLTQIKSKPIIEEVQPKQPVTAPQAEQGQGEDTPRVTNSADLVAKSLDAARLEAQISKDWDGYQKLPRRKFVGARVQEYRYATYVEAWRQKVEKIGNLNYPEEAKAQKLYGQLRMTVTIHADGTLESVYINKSSGHKVLDDAAKRIVQMSAPFAAFPNNIRKDIDILSITRTWTFTREDTVSGEN
jgi:protein TonB